MHGGRGTGWRCGCACCGCAIMYVLRLHHTAPRSDVASTRPSTLPTSLAAWYVLTGEPNRTDATRLTSSSPSPAW
ncbi:hypothetical protein LDK73_08175 [Escherichia coli]|nr:hypothetical protein [Escherichia coli]